MGIITVKEASDKWGFSVRRISAHIRAGRIEGTYKIGPAWIMPDDAQKHPRYRWGKRNTPKANTFLLIRRLSHTGKIN